MRRWLGTTADQPSLPSSLKLNATRFSLPVDGWNRAGMVSVSRGFR
jgi:hypothetical protein